MTGNVAGNGTGVQRAKIESVADCMQLMQHTSFCESIACTVAGCQRMKRVLLHAKNCRRKTQCSFCKQVVRLCVLHAKGCLVPNCKIVFCSMIRLKLAQRQRSVTNAAEMRGSAPKRNGISRKLITVASHRERCDKVHPRGVLMQRSLSVNAKPDGTANLAIVNRSTSLDPSRGFAPETVGSQDHLLWTGGAMPEAALRYAKDLSFEYSKMDISKP